VCCRSIRNISSTGSSAASGAPAPPPAPPSVERPTSAPPVQEKLQGDPNDPHTLLKAVFHYYCRFGRTGPKGLGEKTLGTLAGLVGLVLMALERFRGPWFSRPHVLPLWVIADNSNFVKLCRDCPDLLDSSFGKTDVDLIFVKSKKKGERRINYARFLDALGMIAIQKYGDMVRSPQYPPHLAKSWHKHECTDPNCCRFCLEAARGVRAEAAGGAPRPLAVPARVHRRQDGESPATSNTSQRLVRNCSRTQRPRSSQVQAVWQKRAEHAESSDPAASDVPPPATEPVLPPASPPSPAARLFGGNSSDSTPSPPTDHAA
jgi:hypothetical protein